VLQCVAVCCSVLQCVVLCCNVSLHVASSYYNTLQHTLFMNGSSYLPLHVECSVLQGVAGCCSVLQCVVLCCNVSLHAASAYYNTLQHTVFMNNSSLMPFHVREGSLHLREGPFYIGLFLRTQDPIPMAVSLLNILLKSHEPVSRQHAHTHHTPHTCTILAPLSHTYHTPNTYTTHTPFEKSSEGSRTIYSEVRF